MRSLTISALEFWGEARYNRRMSPTQQKVMDTLDKRHSFNTHMVEELFNYIAERAENDAKNKFREPPDPEFARALRLAAAAARPLGDSYGLLGIATQHDKVLGHLSNWMITCARGFASTSVPGGWHLPERLSDDESLEEL